MKQILAILTLIASLTFTSCEDFLTEEVRGQQNLDTYFQSVEEAESFITGCYQAIKVQDRATEPSQTSGNTVIKASYAAT